MAFDKRKSLQNALAYTQQGKWDRAIAEYESIRKADPGDLTVCNNLGDLYARTGKTAEAIDQYLKLGELYRGDGLSVKAIAVYKKIAKLDPTRTEAYVACADLYWEQGLVGEAKIQMATVVEHYAKAGDALKLIESYRRLVQFDPMNATIIVKLADALLKEGMREAAASEYDRAAQAAQAAGRSGDAKRLFQKARDLMPDTSEPTLGVAEALVAEQKLAEALEVLGKLTATNAGDAKAWRLLGEVQAVQGRDAEAVAGLQRAVALGMPELEVARPLGNALLRSGRIDEVVDLCRRVTEASLTQGEPDRALAWCRELLAAEPRAIPLHTILTATLQGLGRDEEFGEALRTLAGAHEAAGDTAAALDAYRRLLVLDPTDMDARSRLDALAPSPSPPAEVVAPESALPDAAEPPVVVLDESAGEGIAETTEAALASLEDLELSLGKEDAALLLDEEHSFSPEAGEAETLLLPIPPEILEETGEGRIDSPPSGDWPPGEAEAGDAGEPAASEEPSGVEWSLPETPIELEDLRSELVQAEPAETPLADLAESLNSSTMESPPAEVPLVDLSDIDLPVAEEAGDAMDAAASLLEVVPAVPERSILESSEEAEASSQVAEQLAEADVYQKYGLEEKARERLLEVIRLAPENLAAHQRLKAIYRDRRQYAEAGAESLAIARVLWARGQEKAARAEAGEGVGLAPDDPELRAFLAQPDSVEATSGTIDRPDEIDELPEAGRVDGRPEQTAVRSTSPPWEGLILLPATAAVTESGPPPDVPLLLEFEEAAPDAPEPGDQRAETPTAPTEEDLPKELRALLEESETASPVVRDEAARGTDQAMTDDVAEAEFYLSQGMTEEAEAVLRRMQVRSPEHPAVPRLAEDILRVGQARTAEIPAEPFASFLLPDAAPPDTPPVEPEEAEAAEPTLIPEIGDRSGENGTALESPEAVPAETGLGFVNLGAELDQEMAADEQAVHGAEGGSGVEALLADIGPVVSEPLGEKDYETHYNLGVAYKEMELYDEAIEEFRLTARDPKRALECAHLVGLCYLAKGQPEQAIQDLEAGLAIPGHPPEAYQNLRYDLGTAFETVGDLPRALEQYEMLQAAGARPRDLQARVKALQSRIAPPEETVPTTQPVPRKKKISFI
jgi:pilus assembly protein FimV